MDDFWKFLLIGGIVLIGIVKEVSKKKASEQDTPASPHFPPTPHADEMTPDVPAIPAPWNRPRTLEDLYRPVPPEQKPTRPRNTERSPKKETPRHAPLPQPPIPTETIETTEDGEEFQIRSAEEARRAIVWGEILRRKY
ncbi:MAG: ferrichrome ABC transporter substrate-binding protein [Mediterranea sp.]|jgi:hypothetical protein|nr:ferrichrome ABC transporter substrate-binding protein [Mediterranea sp.]